MNDEAMMKKIIFVILIVLFPFCVFASYLPDAYLLEQGDYDALESLEALYNDIIINLIPFNGANNVNMRSLNYPQRDNVASGIINFGGNFENIDISHNTNQYTNEHMVALGGLESVPTEDVILSRTTFQGLRNGENQPYHKIILGHNGNIELADVEINIQSATDFMYISQERNIYQRPYELYVSRRYGLSHYNNMIPVFPDEVSDNDGNLDLFFDHTSDTFVKLGGVENIQEAKLKLFTQGNDYKYSSAWFDLVLALPYDSYNDNGVVYRNREYPLRDSEDYTSSITIKLTWEQPYEIFENEGQQREDFLGRPTYYGENWQYASSGVLRKETSITIPFAGYSSTINPEYKETTASLIIMPMPAASQLSLNDGDTGPGHENDVAEIQFLMNFGEYNSDSEHSNENVWMFLSASPSPYSSNNNGFVLVHKNAGNILTSYNSAAYKVYVTDEETGDHIEFDGKAKASDFDPINGIGNYIKTHCNDEIYLPSEAEYDYHSSTNWLPPWNKIWEDPTYRRDIYHHYHEYQGTVSVEIEDTALKPDGMLAGQYTSEIYIHVMTSD